MQFSNDGSLFIIVDSVSGAVLVAFVVVIFVICTCLNDEARGDRRARVRRDDAATPTRHCAAKRRCDVYFAA